MEQRDDWHLTEALHNELGQGDPFAAAVRATRMPMVITDPTKPDNPIVFANEAFQHLTGYGRDEIVGRNCRFLQGPETDVAKIAEINRAVQASEDIAVDILNYRKDGSTFWNALYMSPVRGSSGTTRFFFASQLDVSERIEAQRLITEQMAVVENLVQARTADLEAALEAKTLLLHEVDHRVKNNLTMIGALIRLQARTVGDPALTASLNGMIERIDALATVHRRLYQSGDLKLFDVSAFAANLVTDIIGASGRTNIKVNTSIRPVQIASGKAAALGLLLNEIVTNAIKHGFAEGRGGTLSLETGDEQPGARITICDDGPGMPPGSAHEGLGLTLVKRLSKQVGAMVAWSDAAPGARVTVVLEKEGS